MNTFAAVVMVNLWVQAMEHQYLHNYAAVVAVGGGDDHIGNVEVALAVLADSLLRPVHCKFDNIAMTLHTTYVFSLMCVLLDQK